MRRSFHEEGAFIVLSLVRTGPTILAIIASGDCLDLKQAIERFSRAKDKSPIESYNEAGEGDTLIFFSSESSDDIKAYQTTMQPSKFLCNLINEKLASKILRVRVTPPNIVMRLLGDMDRAIDQIVLDLKAQEAIQGGLLQNIDENAVLLNFTTAPVNQIVPVQDFYKRALLVDKPLGPLTALLRAKAQEYLNLALGSSDWNEVAMTLFDAMNQFNLHYQRLMTVLQGLDLGVVIGESWEPEYTVALRKSEVYQVRLLTPLPPQEIKRVAMGLEYDDTGRRIVDFDVYFDGKKLGWGAERKSQGGGTRDEIGVTHRRRLLSKMPAEARGMLLRMEEQIDKSGPRKR